MNTFFLYIIRICSPLWVRLGADARQLYQILDTKLTMDDRRPLPVFQRKTQQKREHSNSTFSIVFISLIYGFFTMLLLMAMKANTVMALTVYFLMFILVLAMILIADFTAVLIDVRDNYIVLPRPVNDTTVLLSRLLHISIHLSKMVIPMALPGIVYMAWSHGLSAGCLFVLLIFLATVLTIFLINLVYLFILKITTPVRFREIINYIQIIFTVFIFASYQLFPPLLDNGAFTTTATPHTWMFFIPSFWFGAAWEVVINHDWKQPFLLPAALAVVVPLLSVWIVIHFLAPSFNKKLSAINAATDESKPNQATHQVKPKTINERLAHLLTKNAVEKAGFLFSWKLTSRSKDYKLKIYPIFGYIIAFSLIYFFIGKGEDVHKKMAFFKNGAGFIFIIYFFSLMIGNALTMVRFSEKFKAAWVYYIAPLEKPGNLLLGVLKALLVKYFLPLFLIIALFALYLKGPSFIPNLLLALANVILIGSFLGNHYLKRFPFSLEWNVNDSTRRILMSLFLFIMQCAVGILHYFIRENTAVIIILIILVTIADWLLLDALGNKTWEQMEA